jgi:hypothetical protein
VPTQPGWGITDVYLHLNASATGGTTLQQNASIVTGLHAQADAVAVLPSHMQRRCWAAN